MTGHVGILNVGAGDIKLVFDRDDPAELIRATRIVKDMLRRGYALLVAINPEAPLGERQYRRALDFDASTAEYIVADLAEPHADASKLEEANEESPEGEGQSAAAEQPAETETAPVRGKKGRTRRVDAASTDAVAVARTAGG